MISENAIVIFGFLILVLVACKFYIIVRLKRTGKPGLPIWKIGLTWQWACPVFERTRDERKVKLIRVANVLTFLSWLLFILMLVIGVLS